MGVTMKRTVLQLVGILLAVLVCSHARAAAGMERDLAYGPDPLQRLDLSIPAAKGFPTVLFIHGGSLTSGDKTDKDYGDVCAPFPSAGIACANVNYRLSPGASWPAPADDVAAAVAWVRTNIGARGGDPHELFLFGHSSGALLVALVGSDDRYLARRKLKSSDLRGVIPMGSIMWDDELEQALKQHSRESVEAAFGRDSDGQIFAGLDAYQDHWPIRHVRAGLPPFLFLIAQSEQEHPPVLKTDKKFVEDARALGNRADYKVLADRTHYSAIHDFSKPGDPTFTLVRDFVRQIAAASGRPKGRTREAK
jgi:acetyl esterase/lipase